MVHRTYERLVQTACGISLLVLVAATEKAFPSLNATAEAARDASAPRQQADPPADSPSAPRDDKSRVALGPIYPDLYGRLLSGAHSPDSRDRFSRRIRELSPVDFALPTFMADSIGPACLFSQPIVNAFLPAGRMRRDRVTAMLAHPLLACCIISTGPPKL